MSNDDMDDLLSMDVEKFRRLRDNRDELEAYLGRIGRLIDQSLRRSIPTPPGSPTFDAISPADPVALGQLFPLPSRPAAMPSVGAAPKSPEPVTSDRSASKETSVPRPAMGIDSVSTISSQTDNPPIYSRHQINVAAPTIVPDISPDTPIQGPVTIDTPVAQVPVPIVTDSAVVEERTHGVIDISGSEARRIQREKDIARLLNKDGEVL